MVVAVDGGGGGGVGGVCSVYQFDKNQWSPSASTDIHYTYCSICQSFVY